MIQRIQTIYLLLGALALWAVLAFESLWQSAPAEAYGWFAPAIFALGGLAGVVGVVAVFLFRDRPRQRRVVLGGQVLIVLLLIVLYGGFFLAGALSFTFEGQLSWGKLLVFILPLGGYVMYFLARRAIAQDIELVRSMDRLR